MVMLTVDCVGFFSLGLEIACIPDRTDWGDHHHAYLTDSRKSERVHTPRYRDSLSRCSGRRNLEILAAGSRFQLERSALHDAQNDGGPPVIMGSGLAEDFTDRRLS